MSLDETLAKSAALDRLLASPLKDGTMPEIGGGGKMIGEIEGLFDDIRRAVEEAKLGIAGAGAELMTEVRGMKAIETKIRAETKSVTDFKTRLLGNATAGENQEADEK